MKYKLGWLTMLLILLDQGIKGYLVKVTPQLIDVCHKFNEWFGIHPCFNEQVNWLNVKFGLGMSKGIYLVMSIAGMIILVGLYIYWEYGLKCQTLKYPTMLWYIGIGLAGLVGGVLDKVIYGATLDFIEVQGIGIFDLKDCYLVIAGMGIAILIILQDSHNAQMKTRGTLKSEYKKFKEALHAKVG